MVEIDRNGLEVLDPEECLRLLERAHVGVAVHSEAIPAIFPVNYVVADGSVVSGAVVAFEVDDTVALDHSGWSVMVVGIATEIRNPGELAWARRLPLRSWGSNSAEHYVRVLLNRVTGRRIDGSR